MRTLKAILLATSLLVLLAATPETVRSPAVAGSFYPAQPEVLAGVVDGYLKAAPPAGTSEPLIALIAPHAGYPFSGPVAAYSFAQLTGRNITRVVVIAPSHYERFPFIAAYDGDAYRTPLGDVPVDKEFVRKLAKTTPVVQLSRRGHDAGGRNAEHSLEVELPFLQRTLGKFKLVPLVMGDRDFEQERALGLALAQLIKGPETLIVASSDLSHYHSLLQATRMDRKMLQTVEHRDYRTLNANLRLGVWEACGGGPIIAAMIAAEQLGANRAEVLKYATSGDSGGDQERVVGYAAVAFTRAASVATEKYSLTEAERAELLGIARQAVQMSVKEGKQFVPPEPRSPALREERGAFVTLKKKGDLRGCIGRTLGQQPLYLTVRDVAVYAAQQDPRFPAVTNAELGELEYEISVLSPMRKIHDAREVRVGEHGLLVRRGFREGLLLPQVPVEQKWDRQTFLAESCHKAGLDADAWKDPRTDLFVFTALVFSDGGPRGRGR